MVFVAFLMVNVSRSNLTNMIFQLGWFNHQPDFFVVEVFFMVNVGREIYTHGPMDAMGPRGNIFSGNPFCGCTFLLRADRL